MTISNLRSATTSMACASLALLGLATPVLAQDFLRLPFGESSYELGEGEFLMTDNESKSAPRYLEKGQVVIAECGSNCSDMDLILYDESGREVSADIETDAVPVVQAPYEGVFTIEAVMTECSSYSGCSALLRFGDVDFSDTSELTPFEFSS